MLDQDVVDVVDKNEVSPVEVIPQLQQEALIKTLTFSVNVPVDINNGPLVGNFGGVDFTVNEIASAFHSFVQTMVGLGLVPTVEKAPLKPLSMGNYSIVSDVRPHVSFVPYTHKSQAEQESQA